MCWDDGKNERKKKMKILFIFPDVNSFHKLYIHFGIGYIATVLKTYGYKDIKFLSVSDVGEYEGVIRSVLSFKPDIVGFSSVETQFNTVARLSEGIKKVWQCIVVCGGAFPTLNPECLKKARGLDGIFRGESEQAFLKFVRTLEKGNDYHCIENFCFYDEEKDRLVCNDLLPLETDLDRLGFPAHDIFDFQKVVDYYGGVAPFLFNRGCPYDCSFCSNRALAGVYGRRANATRRRSVNSCIAEIKDVQRKYRFGAVHIWDDLFTSNRRWLYEFLDKYNAEINKPFMCTVRSNLSDDELFKRLKEGGCYRVHMSLESGNDFIRNTVMNRNISREAVINSFSLAKKYGIKVNATSIIGLPFETEEMIMDTIRLLGMLKVESAGVNIFYPYKGVRLREICEEYGMVAKDKIDGVKERREGILNLPHIRPERLQYYYDNFQDLVRREEEMLSYVRVRAREMARRVVPATLRSTMRKLRKAKRWLD